MTNRETFVAAFAQALAPKLYELCDNKEARWPFGDTREEFEGNVDKLFNPVGYWTDKATEIAEGLATVFEAGDVDLSVFDYDKAAAAMVAFRADLDDPTHPQHHLKAGL